jgi:hypothetical protein
MNKNLRLSRIPLNQEYDWLNHSDIPLHEYLDLSDYDILYAIEPHFPFTDLVKFKDLLAQITKEKAEGLRIAIIFLGDCLDTPKNGKLRGDYPRMTQLEVAQGFERQMIKPLFSDLKVLMLNNHDFEFMELKDHIDKKAYNLWLTILPQLKSSGCFISKRIVKVKFKGSKLLFEHEHLTASTVKNRAWKFSDIDFRIFAGQHEAWINENIYESERPKIGKNISVPPFVTGQFQYSEERLNPPLVARALRISWDKRTSNISISEE